jgi:serine/threonine protein kinase
MVADDTDVGAYQLGALLEGGYMAAVHRCLNPQGESVIAKTYRKKNPAVATFKSELQILRSLASELIVACLDWFETADGFVMILQDGGDSLFDRAIAVAPMQDEKLRKFALQMTLAVKEVHDHNLIHGDIKLENFVIDRNDRIRLIDFGLSEKLPENEPSRNLVCGSRFYQPPEILQNAAHDQKVDIWALGVTLFGLGTGGFPFTTDEFEHYSAVIVDDPCMDPARELVSDEFADLVQWMLSKDPRERPSIDECLAHSWLATARDI